MIGALDCGNIGALSLLDLSAAFDTVDHTILADVLTKRFGVQGLALDWIVDFLSERNQVVRVGSEDSKATTLCFGVPQGSVLGPKIFIQYAEDVFKLFEKHGLNYHLYADDMQGLKHGKPSDVSVIVAAHEASLSEIRPWCSSRRLQLNETKTELFWFGTAANLRKMTPHSGDVKIGESVVAPSTVVRDLGVMFDAELSMHDHVSKTTQSCFYHLRRLRSVRRQLGRDTTAKLVSAFILSRLDYCNAVLAGLPAATLAPLQRVIHAAARLVLELRPRDHVTPALRQLHWLPIAQRIDYKLCMLVHKISVGHAPKYLSDLLTAYADVPSKSALRAYSSGDYIIPRTNLKLGERAFSVAAPRAWNRLPTAIKLLRCTTTFKRHLKTFLFSAAYGV